ncbi:MAG: hypothetical protein LLG02_03430, partial [Pelosinus sp.]|nr:hypothetical protein [Pelosinus sp.]
VFAMNRESVRDILAPWCNLFIPLSLLLGPLYLLYYSTSLTLWLNIPLLAIVFLIKYDINRN